MSVLFEATVLPSTERVTVVVSVSVLPEKLPFAELVTGMLTDSLAVAAPLVVVAVCD